MALNLNYIGRNVHSLYAKTEYIQRPYSFHSSSSTTLSTDSDDSPSTPGSSCSLKRRTHVRRYHKSCESIRPLPVRPLPPRPLPTPPVPSPPPRRHIRRLPTPPVQQDAFPLVSPTTCSTPDPYHYRNDHSRAVSDMSVVNQIDWDRIAQMLCDSL